MRGTGRSYRMVLRAILAASEGEKVVYVIARNSTSREFLWNLAVRLSEAAGPSYVLPRYCIKFPNGCQLIFLTSDVAKEGDRFRGHKGVPVFIDHEVLTPWRGVEELVAILTVFQKMGTIKIEESS